MSNNQLQQQKSVGITSYLSTPQIQSYLQEVVGKHKDKFITNLVSVTNQNKQLQKCTNVSLMSGALAATTLNLNLNSSFGYAYLVPFKNNKLTKEKGYEVYEAQFQIGYKGFIQLALRTGEYQKINAIPVYKSQFQSWNALTEELNIDSFDDYSDDEVVGYVSYFRLNNGFEKTIYWSLSKMEKHADTYSQAFSLDVAEKIKQGKIPERDMWKYSSYWYKNFDGMALKTMLRQILSKWGILSEELQKAIEEDQTVIIGDSRTYVDNPNTKQISQPQQQTDLNSLSKQQNDEAIEIEIEQPQEQKMAKANPSLQMKNALIEKGVDEVKAEEWCMTNAEAIPTFLADPASIDVIAEELTDF